MASVRSSTCAGSWASCRSPTSGAQVSLSLATDFEDYAVFTPGPGQSAGVTTMLDQVIAWSEALAPLRVDAAVASAA